MVSYLHGTGNMWTEQHPIVDAMIRRHTAKVAMLHDAAVPLLDAYMNTVFRGPGGFYALLGAIEAHGPKIYMDYDDRQDFGYALDADCAHVEAYDVANTCLGDSVYWRTEFLRDAPCRALGSFFYGMGMHWVRYISLPAAVFAPGTIAAAYVTLRWNERRDVWWRLSKWFASWVPVSDVSKMGAVVQQQERHNAMSVPDTAFFVEHALDHELLFDSLFESEWWPSTPPEAAEMHILRKAVARSEAPHVEGVLTGHEKWWLSRFLRLIFARAWEGALPLAIQTFRRFPYAVFKSAVASAGLWYVPRDRAATEVAFERLWMPLLGALGYERAMFCGVHETPQLTVAACKTLLTWVSRIAGAEPYIMNDGFLFAAIARTGEAGLLQDARNLGVPLKWRVPEDLCDWVAELPSVLETGFSLTQVVFGLSLCDRGGQTETTVKSMKALVDMVCRMVCSSRVCRAEAPVSACPVCAVVRWIVSSQNLAPAEVRAIFRNQRQLFEAHRSLEAVCGSGAVTRKRKRERKEEPEAVENDV